MTSLNGSDTGRETVHFVESKEEKIKKLKYARGQSKGTITRMSKVSDGAIEGLEIRRDRLTAAFRSYEALCVEIADDEDPTDIEDKYCSALASYNKLIAQKVRDTLKNEPPAVTPSPPVQPPVQQPLMLPMPGIQLPTFDGKDFTQFRPFLDLFNAVVDRNTSYSDVQKLYYLKSYLKGEALNVVQNLPLTDCNYSEALKLVKERYDNKYKIVSHHVSIIMDLPKVVKCTSSNLWNLVSSLKLQLKALQNLGQPVDKWDAILINVIIRKLDSASIRDFEMQRNLDNLPTITELIAFIEKRANAMENADCIESRVAGGSSAVVSTRPDPSCTYCKCPHKLYNCPQFKLASLTERTQFVSTNKLCSMCLNSHGGSCRYKFQCNYCKKAHNSLLHSTSDKVESKQKAPSSLLHSTSDEVESMHSEKVNNLACSNEPMILLPTVKVKLLTSDGNPIYIRAVLDSASQTSFVTKEVFSLLGFEPTKNVTNITGIGAIRSMSNNSIQLQVHSCHQPVSLTVNCNIVDKITSCIPQCVIDMKQLKLPSELSLADDTFNIPGEVQLLLGAEIFFQTLLEQPKQLAEGGPCVVYTSFGHVIAGNTQVPSSTTSKVTMFCQTCDNDLSTSLNQFWEAEKVLQVYDESASEKQLCENIFQNTVTLDNDKFTVALPLKSKLEDVNDTLGDSFSIALQRFLNIEKRLQRDQTLFSQYKSFIDEYIELGHGEYIDINSLNFAKDPIYFLPHHPVLKSDSRTTPCRVVFDGSVRTKDKRISINDLLMNGPTVQSELFDILLLFRLDKYVLITDIKKMFRSVLVDKQYRTLQLILWRESINDAIKCIQLNTVTYGLKVSSYLATRCLIELANRFGGTYPLAASALRHQTYVDDVVCTTNDTQSMLQLKKQLIELLALGGFHLHKWCTNNPQILEDIPQSAQHFNEIELGNESLSIKTLGLTYEVKQDVLKFSCADKHIKKDTYTKRDVSSCISKIFDPLGIIGPITVSCKVMLQRLWQEKLEWDTPLPAELSIEWEKLAVCLTNMEPILFPRHVGVSNAESVHLIGFCDGSLTAHGCCIYIRTVGIDGKVSVNLLCSKSRINPCCKSKLLTVPRIKLNAANLLAALIDRVYNTLKLRLEIPCSNVILYSDSQIVLAWLQTEPIRLNSYVGNRVKKITELTQNFKWCYVNTDSNPADILSRGIDPSQLSKQALWFCGPEFLLDETFECHGEVLPSNNNLPELSSPRPLVSLATLVSKNFFDCFNLNKYSSILKMQRVLAYALRFIHNTRSNQKVSKRHLSPSELQNALKLIIKNDQAQHFSAEIQQMETDQQVHKNSPLKGLHVFIDSEHLIRVGGRLQNTLLPFVRKHPIVLPKRSVITHLIIENEHRVLLHAGNKEVLASLSSRFWLINSTREIKKVLHRCIICFKLKAKLAKQLMGSLPFDRVNEARPFQKVGTDYAGPFLVKQSRVRNVIFTKAYVVIFVCFVVKSIHIELVSDMTTECFLAALNRFISRRNLPTDIYCDNAATYKGAKNELEELYLLQSSESHQDSVVNYCAAKGITFHMIPSYSPVFGGLWESSIKCVKYHLKRIVGKNILTYEELNTVLVQIEGVLNSRPLTPMTSDVNDLSYLTPAHFLVGAPLHTYPDKDLTNIPTNRLKFWNLCKQISQSFWKVWRNSYLHCLQNRPKWRDSIPNVQVGSLVILKGEDTPPLYWPMGRVVRVIPGKDGKVRVLEIKTNKGTYLRSVTKICVLPIEV